MYIYIYVINKYIHIYIYIYIERERYIIPDLLHRIIGLSMSGLALLSCRCLAQW